MHVAYRLTTTYYINSTADCGAPPPPVNGDLPQPHTNTTEGSVVVFHTLTKFKYSQLCDWISRKLRIQLSKLRSAPRKLHCKQGSPHRNTPPSVTHASVELRESLLEYYSQ